MVSHEQAARIIGHALNSELQKGRVLLLLSGGSAAQVAAEAVNDIRPALNRKLFMTLADERYGVRDHVDSNWRALKKARLHIGHTKHYEILWEDQLNSEHTALEFEVALRRQLQQSDCVIAILGIGEDGHTAGILPGSPASREDRHLVAVYREGKYERITITPAFFEHIDMIFLYAEGASKQTVLGVLKEKHIVEEFPAELIKQARNYMVLYNKEST